MSENQSGGDQQNAEDLKDPEVPTISDVNNASPEEVEKLVKANQTLLAQKKHWRQKAMDPATGKPYETLLTEARAHSQPNNPPPKDQEPETDVRIQRLELSEEKRQFGHAHSLAPEEADSVFAFAQGLGLKPKEALEHPFVKSGIAALRNEAKAANATLGPSSRSPVVEGKTFGEMSIDEKRKNFGKVVQHLNNR